MQVFSKVSKFAQVCITGDAADELFGGYSSFANIGKYELLPPFMRPMVHRILSNQSRLSPYIPRSVYQLSLDENILFDSIVSNGFKVWEMSNFLTKDAYNIISNDLIISEYPDFSMIEKLRFLFMKQKLPNQMFYKVDRSSMAYGVEARPILCSNRIVDIALKTGIEGRKVYNKPELRSLINSYAPTPLLLKLQKRGKTGFGFPASKIDKISDFDIQVVADKLKSFISLDRFIGYKHFNKRQITLIKTLSAILQRK